MAHQTIEGESSEERIFHKKVLWTSRREDSTFDVVGVKGVGVTGQRILG